MQHCHNLCMHDCRASQRAIKTFDKISIFISDQPTKTSQIWIMHGASINVEGNPTCRRTFSRDLHTKTSSLLRDTGTVSLNNICPKPMGLSNNIISVLDWAMRPNSDIGPWINPLTWVQLQGSPTSKARPCLQSKLSGDQRQGCARTIQRTKTHLMFINTGPHCKKKVHIYFPCFTLR